MLKGKQARTAKHIRNVITIGVSLKSVSTYPLAGCARSAGSRRRYDGQVKLRLAIEAGIAGVEATRK